jgi:rare lipoprotein A
LKNKKSIVLRINDRGPFVNDRIIDLSSKAADILDLKREGTGLVRVQILKDKSLYLEKLAKLGAFPEVTDLKEAELPNVTIPNKVAVEIKDTKNKKIVSKKINYNLKNLNKEYKIFIKLASFSSKKNAEIMKKKVSYINKVKIYKIFKSNKVLFQVKAGPFSSVEKVDELHSLLLKKGMQGAKIIIE